MSLFKRTKQVQQPQPVVAGGVEKSLLDMDDNVPPEVTSSSTQTTAKKAGFLNWTGSKRSEEAQRVQANSPAPSGLHSGLASPLQPSMNISPRISTSSRTSIFERSVDSVPSDGITTNLVDPSHSQLVVDNQIPSVLDASVEAITSNQDLDKVEVVTAQPTNAESLTVPSLPNPWSEEENISTAQIANEFQGTAKRLSFVSYADLLGVEQAEADAESHHSLKSLSPKPRSPDLTSAAGSPIPARPGSTPSEIVSRRQKSVVTTGVNPELELTRSTMADTILAPQHTFENENPWAT